MGIEIVFTHERIAVPPLHLESREAGASVEFHGIVREMEEGRALAGLAYEAYESMARKYIERIFSRLASVHSVETVIFIHRLGWVPVGETAMYVRVIGPHRGAVFAVCAAGIMLVKQDVPIWKSTTRPPDARPR